MATIMPGHGVYYGRRVPSANPYMPIPAGEVDPWAPSRPKLQEQWERMEADRRKMGLIRNLAMAGVGGVFAAPAVGALFSSAPAAASGTGAAGWTMPGVSAPVFGAAGPATGAVSTAATAAAGGAATAGKLASLGRLFSSPGMDLAVNAGLSLVGMRQQNKAAEQARLDLLAQQREALALERQRLEMEARNADLDREDARALNEAINELKRRELAAAEEERAYVRAKDEARETRLAPYRGASEAALRRLQSLWGL